MNMDVIIDSKKLAEAKQIASNIETSIKRTEMYCGTLVSTVASSSWKGKSREAFLSYIEIIEGYHKDLTSAVQLQTKALNNLERYINEFSKDNRVSRIRDL